MLYTDASGQTRSVLQASPAESAITIDGQLDEPDWQEADVADGFLQLEPREGRAASQAAEVRVLYGPDHLYVGARLYDEAPDRIGRALGRRDEFNQADWFIVSIDSYSDQQTAFVFAVNAAGVQYDAIRTGAEGGPGGGGSGPGDNSWDAIWESGVSIMPEGWAVEMRIPYSMLRFSNAPEQVWGVHFARRIPRLGERSEWPLIPRTERSNLVANYGQLRGIEGVEPRRNIQVRPYSVSRIQTGEDPDRPGELHRQESIDAGGDLKVGLGPSMTLDVTINPDFGQVESDPAELNLTAFETIFEERRPFFVEGVQIYEFSLGRRSDLLYTRRIGAQAPIIGAAKLSGRTGRGLSFGVLSASTGSGFNPERHFGVARLSQEFGAYSSIGGILTGFDAPGLEGRHRSLVGGIDWDVRLSDNAYGIEGFATFSHRRLPGEDAAVESGFAGSLEAARRRGIWTYNASLTVFDDRYNPNDLGLLRRNNYVRLNSGFRHEINRGEAFGPFQRADAGFFANQEWSYGGIIDQGAGFFSFSNWTLEGFQSLRHRASGSRLFGGYDLFETRGLGPWAAPTELDVNIQFGTDSRRSWELQPSAEITFHGDGGRGYGLSLEADWTVGARISLRGSVDTAWERGVTAWSSNEAFLRADGDWHIGAESRPPDQLESDQFLPLDDQGPLDDLFAPVDPIGDPDAYFVPIFGSRDTHSVDFTVRSSVTFTPQLSLQFYGQLFLARGRYENFQLLQDPDTLVSFDAFPKRDAFNLSSFQANTVLRWEYLPGSNLYLVWVQGRQGRDELHPLAPDPASPYDTSLGNQLGDTFRIFPDNQFIFKIDYTFLR